MIIDNDLQDGEFSGWLRRSPDWQALDPDAIEAFWLTQGFDIERIATEWRFDTRADLEAVLRLELPTDVVEDVIREHDGLSIGQRYLLLHRTF